MLFADDAAVVSHTEQGLQNLNDKEGNSNRFIFLNIYINRTSVLFKSKLNKFSIQLHHQILVHGYFIITIQFKNRINQIFLNFILLNCNAILK